MRYEYRVPEVVWTRAGRSGYRLVLQHQPKARPGTMELRFELPEGARDVVAKGFDRRDEGPAGVLVWEGPLDEDMVLEVSWRG